MVTLVGKGYLLLKAVDTPTVNHLEKTQLMAGQEGMRDGAWTNMKELFPVSRPYS